MYFPSKRDLWLTLVLWGAALFSIVPAIMDKNFIGLIIGLIIAIFIGWLWFTTGYFIGNGKITIKFGPFKKIVHIKDISKINKTRSPFSAPALSMDRLEINYGKFDGVLISPINEYEFIHLLLQENPNIQVDDRLRELLQK